MFTRKEKHFIRRVQSSNSKSYTQPKAVSKAQTSTRAIGYSTGCKLTDVPKVYGLFSRHMNRRNSDLMCKGTVNDK